MARKIAVDYQEKVTAILDAAAQLFAEKGYDRTSMADVARAAGFSKASAYHYFESKEAILFALLRRSIADVLQRLAEADPGTAVPPRERLARLTEAYVGAFAARIFVLTPVALNLDQLQPAWRDEIRRLERQVVDRFAEAAAAVGLSLPPRIAAYLMLGAVNWSYYWYDPTGNLSVEELGRYAALLFTDPALPARRPG